MKLKKLFCKHRCKFIVFRKFIEDDGTTMIQVTRYRCPKCGREFEREITIPSRET